MNFDRHGYWGNTRGLCEKVPPKLSREIPVQSLIQIYRQLPYISFRERIPYWHRGSLTTSICPLESQSPTNQALSSSNITFRCSQAAHIPELYILITVTRQFRMQVVCLYPGLRKEGRHSSEITRPSRVLLKRRPFAPLSWFLRLPVPRIL